MKLMKNTARVLLAISLLSASLPAFSADQKSSEGALMEPVKSVLDHYIAIQKELAKDSLKGVEQHAAAISKAVKGDEMKMLPADVARKADALAAARDLKKAREAFKPLSASLVKYLADNKAGKGTYHEAYCPMVKASWLQTDTTVKNPYMGKSMLDCGELKN
jgi:hypothetical protein